MVRKMMKNFSVLKGFILSHRYTIRSHIIKGIRTFHDDKLDVQRDIRDALWFAGLKEKESDGRISLGSTFLSKTVLEFIFLLIKFISTTV